LALTRPELTFDPQEIRGRPAVDLGTFRPGPKGKKIENLTFLGEIFQIQTQAING